MPAGNDNAQEIPSEKVDQNKMMSDLNDTEVLNQSVSVSMEQSKRILADSEDNEVPNDEEGDK